MQIFIGVINCHRYIWPRQSHVLAPLTRLTSIKIKFKWAQVEQYSFDKIKRIVACDTLLTYTGFDKTFKIHADAGAFQLGAVISQNSKPIDFYGRKLTNAQQWYTVTEREILIIVETLKYFITILPGQRLIIYTYHKTLTCKKQYR